MAAEERAAVTAAADQTQVFEPGGRLGLGDATRRRLVTLASALYLEGRLEDALRIFRGLVELFPHRAELWSALGTVLTRRGRHSDAVTVLDRALRLTPSDTAAMVNRAECLLALGRVADAAADLARAIATDPRAIDPAANRARQIAFDLYTRAAVSG